MPRPRKHNSYLPKNLYLRSGTYYYVHDGKWLNFGADERIAVAMAVRMREDAMLRHFDLRRAERNASKALKDYVFDRDGFKCVYCGATDSLEVDHVVPAVKGGATSIGNLVVSCFKCNSTKGSKSLAEFFSAVAVAANMAAFIGADIEDSGDSLP